MEFGGSDPYYRARTALAMFKVLMAATELYRYCGGGFVGEDEEHALNPVAEYFGERVLEWEEKIEATMDPRALTEIGDRIMDLLETERTSQCLYLLADFLESFLVPEPESRETS